MGEQVRLTWRLDKEVITEEVTQLNEKEAESAKEESVVPIITDSGLSTMSNTEVNPEDLSLFKDEDDGVFAVPNEQIIIIQPVERAS